jgi:hypothetical protein
VNPLNSLSRPARAVYLLIVLGIGLLMAFVFVEATLEADAQAGLVLLFAVIYALITYALVAAIDGSLRAAIRRFSSRDR